MIFVWMGEVIDPNDGVEYNKFEMIKYNKVLNNKNKKQRFKAENKVSISEIKARKYIDILVANIT